MFVVNQIYPDSGLPRGLGNGAGRGEVHEDDPAGVLPEPEQACSQGSGGQRPGAGVNEERQEIS